MHSIHTTYGLILESRPYGEAGKLLSILTEDFGLLKVVAEGIRLEKSKLRPFVQEYSFGRFSVVKGKEYWRLTGAEEWERFPARTLSGPGLEILARLTTLLKRLIHGEEDCPELFNLIISALLLLQDKPELKEEEVSVLESVLVYLVLRILGYIGNDPELEISVESLNPAGLSSLAGKKTLINKHINKALKESHL